MCYKNTLITLAALASVTGFSANAKDVDARKITCEEFVGLDDDVRPQLVLFIQGSTKSGKVDSSMVEIEEESKPVAFVMEECRKTPKATVWQKVESYVKNTSKKL